MRRSLLPACVVSLVAALTMGQGCVTTPSERPSYDLGVGVGVGAGSGSGSSTGSGTMPPPVTDTGLPCEVSLLLVKYCRACHSTAPISGAATSLVTYEDLLAPMPGDPSTTVGAASLARMKDTAAPMPPGFLLPDAEVAPFEAWVSAGMPAEACSTDGTVPDDGAPVNPYDTPPVCTSDSYWTQGDESSPDMLPGRACIACHSAPGGDEGPRLRFSGTVYPTAHEPDDCNGIGGAQIEITDANGAVFTATAHPSGNFYQGGDPADMAMPIKARVLHDGKILPMITAVDTGDCNACHTQNGKEGAPGRIILPP
jgi:mono/diheme cytochrome c family protein